MKFNFRQGIVRSPMNLGEPSFMIYNPGNNTMTIAVGVDLVRVSAAYGDYNYLIEEREDSIDAWGPFNWDPKWGPEPGGNYTLWVYWDINRATGMISRGFTPWEPLFGSDEPVSPLVDQHWFDLNTNVMKVWDNINNIWRKQIRVFGGSFTSGTITIYEYPLGSQVGLTIVSSNPNDWPEHGFIMFGADMKAIRYNDTNFVTTVSPSNTFHGSFASPLRLELLNPTILAAEPIPAFYAVSNDGNGYANIARGQDPLYRPIGIVLNEANPGDPIDVVTHGIVFNDQWNWDVSGGNKELFCGPTGELQQGLIEFNNGSVLVGTILGPQTILVDIDLYAIPEEGGDCCPLEYDVEVIGTDVGAVDEGFVFPEGLSFTDFVVLVSQRTLPPSYTGPTLTISSNPAPGNIEVGTILSPNISRNLSLNDAGPEVSTSLRKNSIEIATAFPHVDPNITIGTSSIVYNASVTYEQGNCKLNNRGAIDCNGRIEAGTINSNSITFIGSRKAFAGTPASTPNSSATVRALPQTSFASYNNSTVSSSGVAITYPPIPNFTITIPVGATRVVFSYPASSRAVASVKYQELSYSEVKANFVETSTSVEGANGFVAVPYRVYTYIPVEPFSLEVHYEVYI